MGAPFRSLAELKRAIQPGVKVEILEHWQDQARPDRAPLAGRIGEVITASSGQFTVAYPWPEDGTGQRVWASTWPKAADVDLHDDGSWTVDYGAYRRAGEEHRKTATRRIVS